MYFKRLELYGFKSFADKTRLNFEPGVTAVVGPNGCGKSNIADSIKWVLGEQSAKELRGARMEDVIFSGTANKDPISMAEVSLVLSNEDKALPIDYDEVVITRKLFRTGESEYYINKMPVRLKDINDLLAGTGIGTSSYSMIEQGRIGLICSSKPEERRTLLEEASGITKYKAKKKEALRKLEATENNLLRINDIIIEVERQIKSIERQAKKAEKYKADYEILKDFELKYSLFNYRNIMNDLKTMELEHQDMKRREDEGNIRYLSISEELNNSRKMMDALNEELSKLQREISETDASLDKNAHTVEIDKERIGELSKLVSNLNVEIKVLEEKYTLKKSDLIKYTEDLGHISKSKEIKENALKAEEARIKEILADIESLNNVIKESKDKIVNILSEQTAIKNNLIKMGAEIQSKRIRLNRLSLERENISREKSEFDSKIVLVEQKAVRVQEELSVKKGEVVSLRSRLSNSEASLAEIRKTLHDEAKNLEVLKSKNEMLKELVDRHEGFGIGVKAIIEKCSNPMVTVKAIPFADIVSIDSGYEQAVENVLGNLTDAVLVNTKLESQDLINFIRTSNSGRVNFIILEDTIEGSSAHQTLGEEGAKSLESFVKCPEEYRKALKYVLKDTFVVENALKADELFGKYRDHKFVTKDGYFRNGPIVFGGAMIEAETSVLGRKERINEIKHQMSLVQMRISENKLKEQSEEAVLNSLKDALSAGETSLREREMVVMNVETEKQSLFNEMKRVTDEVSVLDAEIYQEESDITAITKDGEELNVQLNIKEDQNQKSEELLLSSEDALRKDLVLKENTLVAISSIKGELSSIQVTFDSISNNLKLRSEECSEIEMDLESKKDQIQVADTRINELQDEILQLELDYQALVENKKAVEEKLSVAGQRKSEFIKVYNEKEALLHAEEDEIENLRNAIRDIEIKLNEVGYRKATLVDRVRDAYKEDLTVLNIELDEKANWEEVKDKINELKDKLDKMGPVNLVAIEEHKELEERFLFLTKQRDDLVNAKDALHKAIVKINATTKQLFIDTFEKVKVEFRSYFRMLFGGGQAEIFLLDENDVLESGIDIVVRPPGKKLQNILLLSGGEKALTAISLLFAIFKVNPSPFCVLDEIDAPLDETNIDRFTRVLQEFLKISQFIIITHNKKTIQMADILYGITMQEKGVSKIVSVKFADHKDKDKDKEEVFI